jgi:predicted lipid-binding transport protein (Tim44 family)
MCIPRAILLRVFLIAGVVGACTLSPVTPPLTRPPAIAGASWHTLAWAGHSLSPGRPAPPRNRSSQLSSPHNSSVQSPAPATLAGMDRVVGFLAGGFLATRIWAHCFGYPANLSWAEAGWALGLLDLAVLFLLGYAGARVAQRIRPGEGVQIARRRLSPRPVEPGSPPLKVHPRAESGLEEIRRITPDFDLAGFGDYARRFIATLHNAWNRQELDALNGQVDSQTLDFLRLGLKVLLLREEISRLEDLQLKSLEVVEAGRDGDRQFITLRLKGQVLDYVLHRLNQQILSGSFTAPASLSEDWCFARLSEEKIWRLQRIEEC